ncbi:AAEL004230-PB [Aedes aegypti]|uniref:AAEL004230-PB n=1 Tax=Aedes aegypti TaxID=7159 RepID=Q17DE8_AEDAE|nr:AAEL004230-PB [Aedes aegypti]
MKVNLRVVLSVLVFVATKSEFANCTPVDIAEKTNKGSSTELVKGAESAQIPKEPPLIFPKDSSVYKIVENDTALKILQARAAAEKGDPADAESNTDDKGQNVQRQPLAKAGGTITSDESIASNAANQTLSSPVDNRKVEDDDDDYNNEDDDDVDDSESQEDDTDYAAEEIQPEDPKREDGLEEQFGDKIVHYPLIFDNTTIEVSSMRQEHIWIIMLGAVFVLALAAYIAMVLYRNRLENRYGMRQRLVTEDDYYPNNEI